MLKKGDAGGVFIFNLWVFELSKPYFLNHIHLSYWFEIN